MFYDTSIQTALRSPRSDKSRALWSTPGNDGPTNEKSF